MANVFPGIFCKDNIQHKVAIKVPNPMLTNFDSFKRELMVMSQFDHKNVIKLLAISENRLKIATELMNWGNLIMAVTVS